MQTTKTKRLVESALLIAVGTVLSILPLAALPYGGSVTLASMLPILLISWRHGVIFGIFAGTAFGGVQCLLGISNLSYFTTWQSIVAILLLDYLLAFAVGGLGGAFRRFSMRQSTALTLGALLASVLRYLCHVIAGATVWAGLSIPTEAALAYSFLYNATYMLPETVVLMAATAYLGGMLDFSKSTPTRFARQEEKKRGKEVLTLLSRTLLLFAFVFDTVLVFSAMQSPETGELDATRLADAAFLSEALPRILIVSAVAILAVTAIFVWQRVRAQKSNSRREPNT